MRDRFFIHQLVRLHRLAGFEDRRRAWREGVATLAAFVGDHRFALPLEGYDPIQLQRSMSIAVDAGWLQDLDWLSQEGAAVALQQLASGLPEGRLRRDLRGRVRNALLGGDARTFVALATQEALGDQRGLASAGVRARVALSLDLPIGLAASVDALALALISRRDSSRDWLAGPSTGSLPSRRLAARLLERAAREAAQLARRGDAAVLRVFETDVVRGAWRRLLADRESLVWRHVAVARGLLSEVRPELAREIEEHLADSKGVTEWRRAAASLAARIAVHPEVASRRCRALLQGAVCKRDPGVIAMMVLGMPRAAESQPGTCEELLGELVRAGGLGAADALVDLRRERIGSGFGDAATEDACVSLQAGLDAGRGNEGTQALARLTLEALSTADHERTSLQDLSDGALDAFLASGPEKAYQSTGPILETAARRLAGLQLQLGEDALVEVLRNLRELDLALLESDRVRNLIALGGSDEGSYQATLSELFQGLTSWMVAQEREPIRSEPENPAFRMRQLRTFLHLVDADTGPADEKQPLAVQRKLLNADLLLSRVARDAPTRLRRAVCASAARACDALLRSDLAEVSDVILVAAGRAQDASDLRTLSEASMVPDIEAPLATLAALHELVYVPASSGRDVRSVLGALSAVAHELPVACSPRVEALRAATLSYVQALERVAVACSLDELGDGSSTPCAITRVGSAANALQHLATGANWRLRPHASFSEDSTLANGLDELLEAISCGSFRPLAHKERALDEAQAFLRAAVPGSLGAAGALVLERVRALVQHGPHTPSHSIIPSLPVPEPPLPDWLPPSRTLGGFYFERPVGRGGVGSVYLVKRADQRDDIGAPSFALKVPEYTAAAARTLSEQEFYAHFRREAAALLALPEHDNLPKFVSFDAEARPKPFLVMEFIEGADLFSATLHGRIDMDAAVSLLRGIAQGLNVMHDAQLAHLDLKPSNVIVRARGGARTPVLVDFGMAGRAVRPGCGTVNYCPPEVWNRADTSDLNASAVDAYSFACVAYEVVTGELLFDAANELAVVMAHLAQDGPPDAIRAWQADPRTSGFGELLGALLAREPADRPALREVQAALGQLHSELAELPWPLPAG